MTTLALAAGKAAPEWVWPLEGASWDRDPQLSAEECAVLVQASPRLLQSSRLTRVERGALARLLGPLEQVRSCLRIPDNAGHHRWVDYQVVGMLLSRTAEAEGVWWGWDRAAWSRLIGADAREWSRQWPSGASRSCRPRLLAYAYLLDAPVDEALFLGFERLRLARTVFGPEIVDREVDTVYGLLRGWGYRLETASNRSVRTLIAHAMLLNRSPLLADMDAALLEHLREAVSSTGRASGDLHSLQRALAALGQCEPPVARNETLLGELRAQRWTDVPAPWAEMACRWFDTSTLSRNVRLAYRQDLARMGRWLAAEHAQTTEPAQWTRATCAAWVATVDRMRIGDYVERTATRGVLGDPMSPSTKDSALTASRAFFRDLQEWEWIPRRFDPGRALETPRNIRALLGPNPRVIADGVWAKLLWAGVNLNSEDLPTSSSGPRYPLELSRAVALTWLFSGQRSDEIRRLRTGCVRWQHDGTAVSPDAADVLARDAICLLDVPTHKTGTSFTKPVDPLLGQAIEVWQTVRPEQPMMLDAKTGERVEFLFAHRAKRVSKDYINRTIIPALCTKAGVPASDVRGKITSHRARSTIASQLYNAKEPMTLFELQAWLGHRSPSSTQFYAKISPKTLAKAYSEAGYFARNVRTIEVLVDRDAVASGAAATGEPWQYYDLGHGWCTYTFFEQCHHRMACARCDFYTPKGSSKAQLLEAKENLQRMLASIPLTEDERAAVDDGQSAIDALLARLTDIPTPAGPTPLELGLPTTVTMLPIVEVRQGKRDKPR
ncbi:tyrosine-type recombinase/integrase [Streptomyces platensis]|uniref:tyrosine-type recombinase/integrase n=1 Tax=Streptomyces platensis TaxID=58346 RepID=UPI00225538EB|nr:tyrosine-type recombinase/integrase [Streptomyces platensis]MCX4637989.1 tyrosine-type recombinase/integrase [Streptomyces platensis]